MGSSKLRPSDMYNWLTNEGVDYFCGVPDSLVSPLSFFLEVNAKQQHTIAANEGNAIGLAIGHHVATGSIPLVYMQNSGLGNALDPLVSLADPSVLSIPMVLLISWRGEPGTADEPQHEKQGKITSQLLELMGIDYTILSPKAATAKKQVFDTVERAKQQQRPNALVLQKGTLQDFRYEISSTYPLTREAAIKHILENLDEESVLIASIGKVSRELFELRRSHEHDLLIVGGMGHASSVALSIAKQKPHKQIICLDGDGSTLMHMGSLTTIGTSGLKNYSHIVFNNGVHDSVGGQPTVGQKVSLPAIAKACGYTETITISEPNQIKDVVDRIPDEQGPMLIEILIRPGARTDLGRPTIPPRENKASFMRFII